MLICVLLLQNTVTLCAQDVVVASTHADPHARQQKKGQITEYTGKELRLKSPLGREEIIPAARVVEIRTTWTASHRAAGAARLAGKYDDAVAAYEQAKNEEPRRWAVRQIMADMVGTHLERGNVPAAVNEFLAIVREDPLTPHLNVIPVAWRTSSTPEAQARGVPTPADDDKFARLLDASWRLGTAAEPQAKTALDELAKLDDPRLAALARIQLWRTRMFEASTGEIDSWPVQLEKMPPQVQAAGWIVAGQALARNDEHEQAALCYLKVPLLFPEQRLMAAEALLAAASKLEQAGQVEEATGLLKELARDYSHLPPAEEARHRLMQLAAKTEQP